MNCDEIICYSSRKRKALIDDNIATALISGGGSVLVAVTALVLNYRGFVSIYGRFASIDGRFASLERRLDMMQTDMKDLYKRTTAVALAVAACDQIS